MTGQSTKRILVCDPINEGGIALLREHADVDIRTGLSEAQLMEIVGQYDALVVRSATRVTAAVIEAADRLQVIGRAGVGTDNIDLEAATRRGIVVVNAPTANCIAAAEHTVAMMLALARHIPQADASLRRGRWEKGRFVGVEVRDKTLGIVGLGRIGTEVAKRAQGLGMEVVACDPFIPTDHAARLGVPLLPLEELLRKADFISIHTPLTDTTRGMIGARELALVKPTARLINCARGGIVDEEALLAALEEGRLAGAAMDVFSQEPAIANPLLRSDKVIATPHLGASTQEAQVGVALDVAEQIIAVLEGRMAEHAVNAPLVPPEEMAALAPFCDLAERLGRFYTQVAADQMERVRVVYSGEIAQHDTAPLKAALIKGLLEPVSEERINLVNAGLIARRRGLEIVEEKTTSAQQFTNLITLEVATSQGPRAVAGTVLWGQPHIVRIDEYWLDFVPQGYLLVSHHIEGPGILGRVGTLLGDSDVNISFVQVGRKGRGAEGVMVLGLDDPLSPELLAEILTLPSILSARVAKL
ncbi:MAG: phosphoglycerate dehydrogenase [Anaerolineae bacterium]